MSRDGSRVRGIRIVILSVSLYSNRYLRYGQMCTVRSPDRCGCSVLPIIAVAKRLRSQAEPEPVASHNNQANLTSRAEPSQAEPWQHYLCYCQIEAALVDCSNQSKAGKVPRSEFSAGSFSELHTWHCDLLGGICVKNRRLHHRILSTIYKAVT